MTLLWLALWTLACQPGGKEPSPTTTDSVNGETTPQDSDGDTAPERDTASSEETDTGSSDAVVLEATSADGVVATVTVTREDADAAGVDLGELALQWVAHRQSPLFEAGVADDLAGELLIVTPEGLDFASPLALSLAWPEDALTAEQNDAQVAIARCLDGLWVPQPILDVGEDSLTIPLEDTHDRCEAAAPPVSGAYGAGGFAIGYLHSYIDTVDVRTPPRTGWTADFELHGQIADGVQIDLLGDGVVGAPLIIAEDATISTYGAVYGEGLHTLQVTSPLGWTLWSQSLVVGQAETPEPYETLARAWAPVFELAPEEAWIPRALEDLFYETVTIKRALGSTRTVELGADEVTAQLGFFGNDGNLIKDQGEPKEIDDASQATVYYSVHELDDGALALQYWAFYRYDPKSGWVSSSFAAHARDRESVLVILDADRSLREVIYAGHITDNGMRRKGGDGSYWQGRVEVPAADVIRECERPLAYIAEGSHALYPRAAEWEVNLAPPNPRYWLTSEVSGGGDRLCPPGFRPGTHAPECATPSDGYALLPLPEASEVTSGEDLGLLFSGAWVDGPLWFNGTFPYNIERYRELDDWLWGIEVVPDATDVSAKPYSCDDDVESECGDGEDGDGDALIDCDDPDCLSSPFCASGPSGEVELSLAEAKLMGESYDSVGWSVAGVGDSNGDGFDDILLGAPNARNASGTYVGAAYLVLGPVTGEVSLAAADAKLVGVASSDGAGQSVAGVGDVDGDGYADLFVGASSAEAAYLMLGPVSGEQELASADATLLGETDFDFSGRSLSGAGDVNGDGSPDLLVGAYADDSGGTGAGAVYLVLGPVSGELSLSEADAKLIGEAENSGAGYAIAEAGDVDGDGLSDVLISGSNGSGLGAAYLVLGPITGKQSLSGADATLVGETDGDSAGVSVAGAGDVNDDGYADLLVGANRETSGGKDSGSEAGAAYLVLGAVYGEQSLGLADAKFVGETSGNAGISVAGAGDIDGDNHADLLIGAYEEPTGGNRAGAAYVVLGPVTGTIGLGDAQAKLVGEAAGHYAGFAVSGAGDVNGDSYSDLLIGATGEVSGGSFAGAVYLVLGGP